MKSLLKLSCTLESPNFPLRLNIYKRFFKVSRRNITIYSSLKHIRDIGPDENYEDLFIDNESWIDYI